MSLSIIDLAAQCLHFIHSSITYLYDIVVISNYEVVIISNDYWFSNKSNKYNQSDKFVNPNISLD